MATKDEQRIAAIRQFAKKARMKDFGETHIRAGTSSDEFFGLLTERLKGANFERNSTKGWRAAAATLGLIKRDKDDTGATIKDEDEEDEDDRDDDDVAGDDPDDEGDAKKKPSDEEQAKRGARLFRRVADRFGLASAPARNSARR